MFLNDAYIFDTILKDTDATNPILLTHIDPK
jgi:hypothetical protein